MPNIDSSTVTPLLEVCNQYKGYCFPMIGLHPTSVNGTYKHELQRDQPAAEGKMKRMLLWVKWAWICIGIKLFLMSRLRVFKFQIELAFAI